MAIDHDPKTLEHDPKPAARRPQAASGPAAMHANDSGKHAAEATRHIANAFDQQNKHLAEGMAKASDFYRESTEYAADRMSALLSAYAVLATGAQEIQRTYLEVLQRSFEMATTGPREIMRCSSLSEVAELQQGMLRKGIDEWLDSSSKLLKTSGRIAEDVVRPIEERVRQEAA